MKYLLILTLIMAGNPPDLNRRVEVAALDECLAAAKSFLERTTIEDAQAAGGIAVGASCAQFPSDDKPT